MWLLAAVILAVLVAAVAVLVAAVVGRSVGVQRLGRVADAFAFFPGPQLEWLAQRFVRPGVERSGVEQLVGSEATVSSGFVVGEDSERCRGRVRCAGTDWSAEASAETVGLLSQGSTVVVREVRGLVLVVEASSLPTSS